jgi:hypothetical protein
LFGPSKGFACSRPANRSARSAQGRQKKR